MRENFTNFATTLTTTSMTTSSTAFTVTSGTGALFPSNGNFYVTVESEIMLISSRTGGGDIFNIGARGQNGTVAAAHAVGVTCQIAIIAYNLTHLWQNVADTFAPEVPPYQLGVGPSNYDNEFDAVDVGETGHVANWVYYPAATGGTTFAVGTALSGHLLLNRGSGDNTVYTAYIPYTSTAAADFTLRLSQSVNVLNNASTDQAQVSFFISDQTNPTAGPDTGNRFKMNTVVQTNGSSSSSTNSNSLLARTIVDTSGSPSFNGPSLAFPLGTLLYLRISAGGSGVYYGFVSGDGITYTQIGYATGLTFSPQSIGVTFHSYNPSHGWVSHTAAVDFMRVGSSFGSYGS